MTKAASEARRWLRNEADKVFQDAFQAAVRLKCEGKPELYVDWRPANRPSPEGAQRLCAGCPLLEACADFAHLYPPGILTGVYGGRTWIDGVIQTD